MGGDEFAMLLTNTDSQRAMAVAEGLVDLLNGYQYSRDGHRITIGCSIGVSMIDGDRSSSCEYLIRADKASFVAKSRGRNLVHIYNPEDREDDELRQGIDWAHRVRQAIGDNRLDLYIQPIREVATGNINHYEALLRLRSQDLTTIIAPGVYIPVVEKAGQIHLLDRWVVNRAVESLSQHPKLERLAINLSGRTFADPQLPAFVEDILLKHGVDPKRIIFEITETTSIANINQTQHMIHRLRGLGCHFALDDFGTGYCSFRYLRQLPVDYIKLDGSYIKNIVSNEFDRAMVRSMNEIAHLLGKKTVAECVETDEVLSYLKDIGVDYVQGYSIGDVHPLETLYR
jgi:EAL domain-containing protein (putative c-di-GMP-specific phosphodiesterase class I)